MQITILKLILDLAITLDSNYNMDNLNEVFNINRKNIFNKFKFTPDNFKFIFQKIPLNRLKNKFFTR